MFFFCPVANFPVEVRALPLQLMFFLKELPFLKHLITRKVTVRNNKITALEQTDGLGRHVLERIQLL
jgi:hypothetical protein